MQPLKNKLNGFYQNVQKIHETKNSDTVVKHSATKSLFSETL